MASGCRQSPEGPQANHVVTSDQRSARQWCDQSDSANGCAIYGPSLITLIAQPESFDGRRVRVIGYVHFVFEGNGLYVSQESYDHGISRNGLWIEAPKGFDSDSGPARRQPNDRYVIVEGTFSATNRGHMGMWSGAIEHVTRLDPWGPPGVPRGFRAP